MTIPQRSPAAVKAEWRKRRIQRWIVAGIVITICLLVLLSSLVVSGKPPPFLVSLLVWPVLAGFFVFLRWNRRCPACGKDAGWPPWEMKNCKNCGAQLRD